MPDQLSYKGIEVWDATPTGAGGIPLKDDLIELADHAPTPSAFDPTTTNDEDESCFASTLSFSTTTETTCAGPDASDDAPVRNSLDKRNSGGITMRRVLGSGVLLTAILCAIGEVGAQPTTSAARAANEQTQAEAKARELTAAAELLAQGKHLAAIFAYQKILAEKPDAATRLAAELGLGKSYVAQDPERAVEQLRAFLSKHGDAEPKTIVAARTALADAHDGLANSYLLARQYDKAIEALTELVEDKNSEETRIAKAWEAIAKIHLQLGEPKKAVEAYQQLLRRPSTGAAIRLEQIRSLLAIDPTAIATLEKFLAENPGTPNPILAEANFLLGSSYEGAKEYPQALAAYQRASSIKDAAPMRVEEAKVGMARAYHQLGETKKAVGVYRQLLSNPELEPQRRFAYVKDLQRIDPAANIAPDIAVHLNAIRAWKEFRPGAFEAVGVPSNDVLLFATKSRQDVIDTYKRELRHRTGQATNAQVQAFAESIDHPGNKAAFVVSPESKTLAAAVSEKAPMGEYFKLLLSGDHVGAAKAAWKAAHTPGNESVYDDWLEAVAKAVQCHDQTFGGRADAFKKWSNCTLIDAAGQLVAANPIADVVGSRPIPEEMLEKVDPAAQHYLDKITDPRQLNSMLAQLQRQNKGWFPGNDVIILTVRDRPDATALPAYIWYLRRTEGRAEPDRYKAVENQLAKGGDARPLSVSEVSRKLAAALANDAPLKDYLKPLLTGDYQTAARVAWRRLHEATTQVDYDMWAEAVAMAIRCQDQQIVDGQADAFSSWVRDDLADERGQKITANPVADLLGGKVSVGGREPAEPTAEVIAQLNGTRSAQDLKISDWAPATDVIGLTALDAGQILERMKWQQRQTAGRADTDSLAKLAKQLTEGGKLRMLTVSPTSKALAAAIRDDAPLADYLKPLLTGDHRGAVQVAWQKMLNAQTDDEYAQWLAAVVAAIRCHDQSFQRAEDFRRWVHSDLKDAQGKTIEVNPIADLIEEAPAAGEKARAAADKSE